MKYSRKLINEIMKKMLSDKEILSRTREDLEKEVRAKILDKKIIRKKYCRIHLDNLIEDEGSFISSVILTLERYRKNVAAEFKISENRIKLDLNENNQNYWGSGFFTLYTEKEETDEEFEKRIQRSLNSRYTQLKIKQDKIKRAEAEIKKNAIKAIELLGDNIYEIFQEINKRNNEKENNCSY